ncbi:ionotropic receptor 21a [Lucilia cuprina]|uniref:ionotropic receptor 21a n=1 Tax=Lucilia cuprina TaxID=7375 RepID=UPI001F064E96|nr:ionotropic receptor 21a [Lucilia cuprina]
MGTIYLIFLLLNLTLLNQVLTFETTNKCFSENVLQRFQLNRDLYQSCESLKTSNRIRRRVEPILKGKPKPRSELLAAKFNLNLNKEQTNSLVMLIFKIAKEYLYKCPPIIYYDKYVEDSDSLLLEKLFKSFPISYSHGEINVNYRAKNQNLKNSLDNNCKSYILFLSDPLMTRDIIGPQIESKVVVISKSTQWKLKDFLASDLSSNIVNLLVIGESLTADANKERPYVLYTHKLYADGLGSNSPVVLTSWIRGALSRPHIDLFPKKFANGFAGHRFKVMSGNQPPYMFRIKSLDFGGGAQLRWDGIEYRLLNMIGKQLNFSIDIIDIPEKLGIKSVSENLDFSITQRLADVGMLGAYITNERLSNTDMSVGHSKDCAAFITLASKALPKYRAIMGPFQWPVWVALICIYLGAIFPIVFTDRLTLRHLMGNWGEIENMFWYVFGMFTNSLTFSGKYSWCNTKKVSTRLLIGSYWIFTIIITACYTGSIIAFVTLPAFPETVDSVMDLLGLFFRVGTLESGGWETWFQNSSHEPTLRLFNKMEYVATLEEGIGNVTQSFFWNYAFLGSRSQLEYLVQANFTNENISRRSALHLSEECFALFQIGYIFPKDSVYKTKLNSLILLAQQAGLMIKIENEVKWSMQRSNKGKLLQASSSSPLRETIQEERQLTTADIEGMFLLMGIGYTIGAIALISEIVGGITNKCRQIIRRSRQSFSSNWSSKCHSGDLTKPPQKPRDKQEEFAHAAWQVARKAAQKETQKTHQDLLGFGRKQFNLTKTTLRELYGDYNKSQPDYVLRDGQIIVEDPVDSDVSLETSTRQSSVETKTSLIHEKSIEVEEEFTKDNIEKMVESFLNDEIEKALKSFDQTLMPYHKDNSQDFDEIEEEVFGSFVQNKDEQFKTLDNLQLFKEQNDLLTQDVNEVVNVNNDDLNAENIQNEKKD